ncbi:MAG: type II toxin-antitoxin system VapC family toxin [Kiritimatiellia bacterium]
MKKTVYIESSVVSYYTARASRDIIVAAHQQCTAEWWEKVLPRLEAFVSPVVLEEISRGDAVAAVKRQDVVKDFSSLEVYEEVIDLAEEYFEAMDIPDKAKADAYHLALATLHGMDYMVTWNCSHIASGRVRRIVDEINVIHRMRSPVICTPEELMEV